MRTLLLSDLHLGPGGPFDIFAAGGGELVQLLDSTADAPTTVVLNGDAVDFLLNDAPLALSLEQALAQARAIVQNPPTAAVFAALGRVAARGGELIITVGNHDVELGLHEVQEVLRGALDQPPEVSARLRFARGDQPLLLECGGARVLVTHGQHNDVWNRVEWHALPESGAAGKPLGAFPYPPGSTLVKELLNPLKQRFGMRFMDLLKPDFQGAVLTGLAVNADAVRVAWSRGTANLVYQLFKAQGGANTFLDDQDGGDLDLGLHARLVEAGLSPEELASLQQALEPGGATAQGGALSFGSDDEGGGWMLGSLVRKLGRAGLERYVRSHQQKAADQSVAYFSLAPADEEWAEAQRLAQKYQAQAVVIGHTHAARWRSEGGLAYLNTGTWIGLMRLPFFDYGDGSAQVDWEEYIQELRDNPGLDPAKQKKIRVEVRFTAGLLELRGGQPWLELLEWREGARVSLGAAALGAAAPS